MARCPVGRVLREPIAGDDFEAVLAALGERRLSCLAVLTRIDACGKLLAGFVAALASIFEPGG
jgi:hypothetical protein